MASGVGRTGPCSRTILQLGKTRVAASGFVRRGLASWRSAYRPLAVPIKFTGSTERQAVEEHRVRRQRAHLPLVVTTRQALGRAQSRLEPQTRATTAMIAQPMFRFRSRSVFTGRATTVLMLP